MSFKMLRMLSNCLTKICKKKMQNINTVIGVVVTSQESKRFLWSQAGGNSLVTWYSNNHLKLMIMKAVILAENSKVNEVEHLLGHKISWICLHFAFRHLFQILCNWLSYCLDTIYPPVFYWILPVIQPSVGLTNFCVTSVLHIINYTNNFPAELS